MHISPQATKSVRGFRFRKEAKNSVTQALQTCTKGAVRAPRRGLTRRVDSDLLNLRQPGFLHLTVAWAPRIIWKCLRTITAARRFGMRVRFPSPAPILQNTNKSKVSCHFGHPPEPEMRNRPLRSYFGSIGQGGCHASVPPVPNSRTHHPVNPHFLAANPLP